LGIRLAAADLTPSGLSMLKSIAAIMVSGAVTLSYARAAERTAEITHETFACMSWAAWHDYGLASLTAKGARASKLCPIRIPAKSKVVVVEDDAGEGASEITFQGKHWFIDNARLK